MPYLLLVIGLLIGLYALYRFFLRASLHEIKSFILSAVILTLIVALFFMAVTGRLPAALAALAAIVPFGASLFRHMKSAPGSGTHAPSEKPMDRDEALKILNLKSSADEEDIEAAYKKLIKKIHPDQDGSEWMAAKLNEARDFLLKDKS